MTGNADGTKMQQTLNNSEAVSPNPQQNGGEPRVHIAAVTGSSPVSPTRHSNDLEKNLPQKNSAHWVNRTDEGFWRAVDVKTPAECWPWRGSKDRDGYGRAKIDGRPVPASRAAYILATGQSLGGLLVCHHCDNPSCCNPAHLYAGTKSDNERDKHRRGRAPDRRGSLNAFSKLTEANVTAIRRLIADGKRNTEIAAAFGVHHSTISLIRLGRKWKHVS